MRSGDRAELAASEALSAVGYITIERNWKTPHCEIDLIARKGRELFFIEVKYRGSEQQGSGLDYVTPAKVRRMERAAETYMQSNDLGDLQPILAAVSVFGADYTVADLVEII